MLGFSLIFGVVKNTIFRILSDWRIILLVVVLAICGYGYYKVSSYQDEIIGLQSELKMAKDSNAVLNQDLILSQTNSKEKDDVIRTLKEEKKLSESIVSDLQSKLKRNSTELNQFRKQLDQIQVVPNKDIGPYLSQTMEYLRSKQ